MVRTGSFDSRFNSSCRVENCDRYLLTRASAQIIFGAKPPMESQMKLRNIVLASVVAGFLTGCASYYRVTEPGTTHVFYTDKVDHKNSGAVSFKDAATQSEITLPASE